MDPISSALLNFGFGGAIVAAFIWLMHFSLTKVLPEIMNTVRQEMAQKRQEFLLALKEHREDSLKVMQLQQLHFAQSLEKMEGSWDKAVDAICQRIDALSERIDNMDAAAPPPPPPTPFVSTPNKNQKQ